MGDISVLSQGEGKPIGSHWLILSIVGFNFISYVCSGLPLAVLPGFVLSDLGLTSVFAGVVISSQYLATLLARPMAGAVADRRSGLLNQYGACRFDGDAGQHSARRVPDGSGKGRLGPRGSRGEAHTRQQRG